MTLIQLFALRFGAGNPTLYSGLGPTFIRWLQMPDGLTLPAPGIFNVGTQPGIYFFTLAVPTFSISFVCDGGAALSTSERYIDGLLDPISTAGQRLGYLSSSIGATNTDPTTIFGYLRRNQEVQEGPATFNKSAGTWNVFARGATLLLFQRNFVNSGSAVTKS